MKKGLTPAAVTLLTILIIAAVIAVGLLWIFILR